jgi:uncharacterized protein
MKSLAPTSLLTLLLAGLAPAVFAADGPGFNCDKATLASEKAVCASSTLSTLDRHLSKTFLGYQTKRIQPVDKRVMRNSQTAWLTQRNQCDADVQCLTAAYTQRIDMLEGRSPLAPMAGLYEVKDVGSLVLFPLLDHYLVVIATNAADDGQCDFEGTATTGAPGVLKFSERDGPAKFDVQFYGSDVLRIPDTYSVHMTLAADCSGAGSMLFDYRRVRP